VNKRTFIVRRAAPLAAALAVGGGAGAAIYAGLGGSSSPTATTAAPTVTVPAQPAAAKQTVSSLTQLYKSVTPGVVDIRVTGASNGGFGFGGQQTTQAEGTGFVYDTKGDIVTNAHVIGGASAITVHFQNGKTAKATLIGADDSSDVAVIKVSVDASQLHPLTLGDSSAVQPGQSVVAIGSPFGLPETMTSGIVSAIDRTITSPNNFSISGAIQTDAPINHGNSGGPLLNLSGEVIGVNAQIESDSGGNDGVGFALAINSVKSVANTLISGGKVQHAYLGISVGDASGSAGALVSQVVSGSPADTAGLKAGDVITALDGKAIASANDLTASLSAHAPGDKVTLTVTRSGSTTSIDVTLGSRPS
jgi:putative serine protease PepD